MITTKNLKPVAIGDSVKFYDARQAIKDNDHSGSNPKHYPIGLVIRVYDYICAFSGESETVCDIQIGDRISTGHFITGVEIIPKN